MLGLPRGDRLNPSSKGSTGRRPCITSTELGSSDTNSALGSIDSVNTATMYYEEVELLKKLIEEFDKKFDNVVKK
jgi:hypothetical protein